jgi:hypothetical protein
MSEIFKVPGTDIPLPSEDPIADGIVVPVEPTEPEKEDKSE